MHGPIGPAPAPKEDLGCAPSELVYGTMICVPGEFFKAAASTVEPEVSDLPAHLCTTMTGLRPEMSHHREHITHMPVDLRSCTFVFVCHDAHHTSLQCTYDGSFRRLKSGQVLHLELQCQHDNIHDFWMPTSDYTGS